MLNNILPRYIATEHSFNPNPIIRINYYDETPSYENWLKWDLGIIDTKREQTNMVMSARLTPPCWYGSQMFNFYVDWVMSTSVWDKDQGFRLTSYHQYNDYNKHVQINLHTDDWEEMCDWIEVAFKYKKIHYCHLHFSISNKDLQIKAQKTFGISFMDWGEEMIDVYSTYEIGKFDPDDESLHTFKYLQDEEQVEIPNPYPTENPPGKRFVETNLSFSCNNPRDWTKMNSKDIAKDILGLSDWSLFYE
jgi:hypothetical protein